MPVFELEAGGKTYEIDAPSMDAAVTAFGKNSGPKGYFGTQAEMATESFDQLKRGANQLGSSFKFAASGAGRNRDQMPPEELAQYQEKEKQSAGDVARGFGNVVQGGLGYVASPINAALRTYAGEPVEKATGIPKEYTEFAVGLAIPGPKIPARGAKVAVPSAAEIKATAGADYQAFRKADVEPFTPETTNALADSVNASLKSKGAFEHLAKPVHETVNLLRTQSTPDEIRSTLEALNSIRSDVATEDKVRRAANIATTEIKQFLARTEPEAAATLDRANAGYGVAKRAEEIDQLKEIAGLRTGRAGYGGNAVNNYRQVLFPIVKSAIEGNKAGWRADEIQAINDIVQGSAVTNTLRGVGQLSPSKGSISTGLAIGTIGATGVVGAAANKLAAMMTSKQIDRLNELVRKRSPAYQEAVSRSAAKYFDAADMFMEAPSAANFARTIAASRSLSAGLSRDGIEMPSGSLIRYLQAPSAGRAEQEDEIPRPIGQ